MNVVEILTEAASHYIGKPLLRFNGKSIAYEEFLNQVEALVGALLSRRIEPNQRVLILARNDPRWLVTLFAALRVGALVIPVNPALTGTEIGYIVRHAKPRLLVVDDDLQSLLPQECGCEILVIGRDQGGTWDVEAASALRSQGVVAREAHDPALMFYTSGTTGSPKGALLSHGAEMFTADMVAGHSRINSCDVSLIASPLTFIYPLVIDFLACLRAGATIVLQEKFHPELVCRAIETEGVTIFMAVPTMYTMMLDWGEGREADLSSLRFAISAGQNLVWSVVDRFAERFGVAIFDLWGMTEGTPITSYDPSREPQGRPESCGRALPGCAVRVISDDGADVPAGEAGEVLLHGSNLFLGYYDNPEATAEILRDGWVHSGDLGRLDNEGYLYIVGRKKDLVIRGGANIYPSEVEEVIYRHPSVQECSVIGVPDPLYGERVKAFVVAIRGSPADTQAILSHCRLHLAAYKVPSEVTFLDALPFGPTGKVLKRVLREREAQR